MSSPTSVLNEITKIGKNAIPTFGAVVFSVLALSPIVKESEKGCTVVVYFALYTLLAACVSYLHRLRYLRYREEQRKRGERHSHLPTEEVYAFMVSHFILMITLIVRLYVHGVL